MSASHISLFKAIEDELFSLAREATDENWQAYTNAKGRYTMRIPDRYYLVPAVSRSIDLSSTEINPEEFRAAIASGGISTGYAYVAENVLPILLVQIPSALEEADKHERNFSGTKIMSTILRYLRDRLIPRWKYLPQALKDLYVYLLFVAVSDVEPPKLTYDERWDDEPTEEDTKAYELELDRFEILREQAIDVLTDIDTSGIITLEVEEDEPILGISQDLDALIKGYLPGRSYYTVIDRGGILNLLQ